MQHRKCEYCGNSLNKKQKKVKFCSRACSNKGVVRIRTLESKKKLSSSLRNTNKDKVENSRKRIFTCEYCGNEYSNIRRGNKRFCGSDDCWKKAKSEGSKKAAETQRKMGYAIGWKVRTKEPSYPEKYFIELLNSYNIEYNRELFVYKWFIDFALSGRKIALEIDGKQHDEPKRKKSDLMKDAYLVNAGWEVIRIRWYNPINEKNKNLLYSQIDSFLQKYFKSITIGDEEDGNPRVLGT